MHWKLKLGVFFLLPFVSVFHDLLWFSGRVPWQPYQYHEFSDLLSKGFIYSGLFMFFVPSPNTLATLLAYTTVVSLYTKIQSMSSNLFLHENLNEAFIQHTLNSYSLFQKLSAFKLVEWLATSDFG